MEAVELAGHKQSAVRQNLQKRIGIGSSVRRQKANLLRWSIKRIISLLLSRNRKQDQTFPNPSFSESLTLHRAPDIKPLVSIQRQAAIKQGLKKDEPHRRIRISVRLRDIQRRTLLVSLEEGALWIHHSNQQLPHDFSEEIKVI